MPVVLTTFCRCIILVFRQRVLRNRRSETVFYPRNYQTFSLVLMQEKVALQLRLRRDSARQAWAACTTSRMARSSTEAYSSARPF